MYRKKDRSLRNIIKEALEALFIVLNVYGCTSDLTEETVDHWTALAEELHGNWMKVAKYKLAAFFAFHVKCTLPPAPFRKADRPDFLVGGGAGRWLKYRLRADDRMELLFSIKQSKKGMPRPDHKMLKEAKEKFVAHMTDTNQPTFNPTTNMVDWAEPPHVDAPFSTAPFSIEEQLRRTVREVFGGKKIDAKDMMATFFPSTSANYINNRKEAGAVGTLLDHPELFEGLRDEPILDGPLRFRPGIRIAKQLDDEDEITQLEASHAASKLTTDSTVLQQRYNTLWERICEKADIESQDRKSVV